MKKIFLKITLLFFALGILMFVPFNSNLTFGYATNTTGTPVCNKERPSAVVLYEPNHRLLPRATKSGELRLNWLKTSRANKYSVAFGMKPGNYIYGAADVGDTNHFVVRFLTPGKKYYFVVRGINDCMPGEWSREWSAIVGARGGVTTPVVTRRTTTKTTKVLPTLSPRVR